MPSIAIAHVLLFFSALLVISCSSQETLSTLNLKQILLEGRQLERVAVLGFESVCKCQCRDDLEVYDSRFNGYKGNCRTKENGFNWCYIPDEAVPYCRHVARGKYADSFYSQDACYTPAPTAGPCTRQWAREFNELGQVFLDMCGIKRGTFDADKNVFQDVIQACYIPNAGQPHMGCNQPIETMIGPALPCDCINVAFTETPIQLDQDRYLYCQRGTGLTLGGRLVDTSSTTSLGSVKVGHTWKARRRCIWRIVPRIGGSWKCVRGRSGFN